MYTQNWLSRFGDGYAYAKNSLTYKENPYFMAAERRRENDIKFEEFQAKHAVDMLQYGLDAQRLGLEREKLEAYKASLSLRAAGKKTAKGALEGIGLSDAILEPIQQDELESINVATFLKDTKTISDEIDTQKMAILAQNTDLVILKKDKDGRNPHYEYNVAGKDPNVVKNASEAAMGKLKDAYDKDPNSVDDGTRTYFRNLANADNTVQNMKFSMNQLEQESRQEHDVSQFTKGIPNLNVRVPGQQPLVMNGEKQVEMNRKLDQVRERKINSYGVPYYEYNDAKAAGLFTTPQEQFVYNAVRKRYGGSKDEELLRAQLAKTENAVGQVANRVERNRATYLDNAVRNLVGVQQPVSFTLEAFETPDKNRAKAVASRLANTIIAEDKENPNPRYNESDVKSMLGKEAPNTSYSLVAKGRGRYALGLSNTEVTGKPIEMDISRQQAEELFGQGQFLDDFYNIRQSMQLTKNTGKWTTDVRGLGRDGAFNLENGLLNKYSVKYHVEDPLKNGGLQVRMYIYDKANQQWLPERTANFGQLLNEAQVTKALSTMGDQYIESVLNSNK
jgi:hypothetical protein